MELNEALHLAYTDQRDNVFQIESGDESGSGIG
jgi:hypothetical protein